jgi:hypothetical protein
MVHYDNASAVTFNSTKQFRIQTFLVIIDLFQGDLQRRIQAYINIDFCFRFLNYIETDADGIASSVQKAIEMFPEDISADLKEECEHWRLFLRTFLPNTDLLLNIIREHALCSSFCAST